MTFIIGLIVVGIVIGVIGVNVWNSMPTRAGPLGASQAEIEERIERARRAVADREGQVDQEPT